MSGKIQMEVSMKSPEEKYLNDSRYHQLVDFIENFLRKAEFSPSEIREAAMLACIHFELKYFRVRIWQSEEERAVSDGINDAATTMEKWRAGK